MARKTQVWSDQTGLALKPEYVARARRGLAAAADWATRNQVRHYWPKWNANSGRFPYHVHLHTDAHAWSNSWNTARTVQGLLAAYQVLGDKRYLETATWGLAYVKSLQVFAPEYPDVRGAFFEETPLADHVGPRDGVECTQALLAHYFATKDKVSLQRAKSYLDWLLNWVDKGAWPGAYVYVRPKLSHQHMRVEDAWCELAAAIPLVQYAVATGEKKYLRRAEYFGDLIIKHILSSDGAFRVAGAGEHHSSTPGNVIDNDDGLGVALVAIGRHSGKRKYLDAAVANADWWRKRGDDLPKTYTTPSVMMINAADVARATGERRYVDYMHQIAERFFALQILRDERPLVQGAFLGEDMAQTYRKGSNAGDFISLRSISYGLLALGKLAARGKRRWNPSYSAFGY